MGIVDPYGIATIACNARGYQECPVPTGQQTIYFTLSMVLTVTILAIFVRKFFLSNIS